MRNYTEKKPFILMISLIIIYFILMFGALSDNMFFHIVGCALFFVGLLILSVEKAMFYIIAMSPNLAIIVFTNGSTGLLGIAYAIVFLKLLFFYEDVKISKKMLLIYAILFVITLSRLVDKNFYDFALILQTLIGLIVWDNMIDRYSLQEKKQLLYFFELGCFLMMLGMIVQYFYSNQINTRLSAVLDDANYTGGVLCVLFTISLLAYCYKLPCKYNGFFLASSLIMGLASGSRGFMVSVVGVVFIFAFVGILGKRERKVVYLVSLAGILLIILYQLKVEAVVLIYENTIGRTLQIKNAYSSGSFMDISSGRIVLWKFYCNEIISNCKILLFGRGFHEYYQISNGGYGLAAHNTYISSIIGIGLFGTISLFYAYFSIIRQRKNILKKGEQIILFTIPLSVLIDYFFLDGVLDQRLIIYFILYLVLIQIYESSKRKNDNIKIK